MDKQVIIKLILVGSGGICVIMVLRSILLTRLLEQEAEQKIEGITISIPFIVLLLCGVGLGLFYIY